MAGNADWTVDVGFNTDELKSAMGGGGAGSTGGVGGFASALKATGIIGILASLKPILDTISFVISMIGGLISYLVVKFLEWTKGYFSDFEKNNLKLAIKINNGIIAGVEWLANALAWVFTLGQKGLGTDSQFELGRFQEDIILESFDDLQTAKQNVEAGIDGIDELTTAQREYEQSFMDSFMTNEEFAAIKAIKDANNVSFKEVLTDLEASTQTVATAVDSGATQVISFTDRAMGALSTALQYIEDKANSISGSSSSSSGSSYTYYGPEQYSSNKESVANAIKESYDSGFNFDTSNPLVKIFQGG